jgi:DNA topoisomerase VI subunit A
LTSTLLQPIQYENCKQTAALGAKLTNESNKLSAESAKQIAVLEANINSKLASATKKLKFELRNENKKLAENLIAKCESANAAVWEQLNTKLNSEIKVVVDKIDDVSRETNNKIITLTNSINPLAPELFFLIFAQPVFKM